MAANLEPATFCQAYVKLAGDIAGIAKWFIIAALVLGIAFAIVETIKKYREQPAPQPKLAAGAIKEVVDALKAFIEALASARAWLALFACGILGFWFAGAMLPTECKGDMTKSYAAGPRPDPNPSNNGAAPSNTSAGPANSSQNASTNGTGSN